MIQAVVFDCFGVLITDALSQLVAGLSASPHKQQAAHDAIRAANKGLIARAESNQIIADLLGMSVPDYRHTLDGREVKNTELLAYILQLRAKYKTALLSNITQAGIEHRFTPAELTDHFDEVVISGQIGYAKPEPEAYEIVAERLGVRLDACVFTDDREEFCDAARGVGMQAVHFTGFPQFKSDLEKLLSNTQ